MIDFELLGLATILGLVKVVEWLASDRWRVWHPIKQTQHLSILLRGPSPSPIQMVRSYVMVLSRASVSNLELRRS